MESEIISAPALHADDRKDKERATAVHHPHDVETDSLGSRRIYKKTSPNSLITLYLGSREIVSKKGEVEPLRGVLFVDPKYVIGHRLFSQLTLTFRYGREDEEVMGLKFCNEAVIALKQIWPRTEDTNKDALSPLQEALLERLGVGAHAFSIEVGIVAPPSVQLIPAKQYSGAPIGTSYDIRAYIADQADEKIQRRSTVKLGIRLIHKIPPEIRCCPSQTITSVSSSLPKCLRLKLSPKALKFSNKLCGNSNTSKSAQFEDNHDTDEESVQAPKGFVDKPFLWTDGKVSLKAALNKTAYSHEEDVAVTIDVRNNSRKVIRKIRIFAVQHVDVCMFSNGKFKNVVAETNLTEPLGPDTHLSKTINLRPTRTATKNWIAVEGALFNSSTESHNWGENTKLAPSSPQELKTAEDRNVFAIYVSYYVKVKLTLSGMGGEVSLKLPFILGHVDNGERDDDFLPRIVAVPTKTTSITTTTTNPSPHTCVSDSARQVQIQKCEVINEISELGLGTNDNHPESTKDTDQLDRIETSVISENVEKTNAVQEEEKPVAEECESSTMITVQVHMTNQSLLTDVK